VAGKGGGIIEVEDARAPAKLEAMGSWIDPLHSDLMNATGRPPSCNTIRPRPAREHPPMSAR